MDDKKKIKKNIVSKLLKSIIFLLVASLEKKNSFYKLIHLL